jgi:predicted membrane-bound spermidine synthase
MLDSRAARRALFGVLFLLSGAAALVYEQLWIRELQQFFGSTIHSITTVVAAYMGGLGLGAYVMGRRADRHANPALLYGLLELAIGVFGLASPWVFRALGEGYLGLARVLSPGLWAATAIKFVATLVVMLIPTFLMGGTLPILTRAFAGPHTGTLRRELALFYGLNTVGGVVGCALGGYVLIEHVGLRPSLLATGVLNLLLGAAALALTRRGGDLAQPEGPSAVPAVGGVPEQVRRTALWLIGITAFASLLYEIAWTRVLVLVVGSSTYAFTTILACFLLGVGIGSLVAVGRGLEPKVLLARAAWVQGAIAAFASLLFPFFRQLPLFIIDTLQIRGVTPTQLIALQSVPLFVVIVPPALGMGLAFPILAELAARRAGTTGSETGRAYLVNTIGSILGSAVTGFVLIHLLGAARTLVLGIAVNVAAALALVLQLRRSSPTGKPWEAAERLPLLLGTAALLIALLSPSWSHRLLDRGPAIYGHDLKTKAEQNDFLRAVGAEQLRFDEGWNATVSVWHNGNSTWLKTNGKADASSVADMNTQVLVGLLPALAHPDPRRVFLVGFGSGTTARTIIDVRGIEHLDVVEIERAVIRAAPLFRETNRDVLRDPRVRLIEDDARSALQLAREPYDLIVSEPSNPWIAGIASLYTPEYFRIARSRLAPGGVFAQWVQMYRVPVGVAAVVVANLRQVFPHVEVWYANTSDLILLGSDRPIRWSYARVASLMAPGSTSAAAFHDWLLVDRPSRLLGRFLLGQRGSERLADLAVFTHTDDHPALEFVAARGLLAATSAQAVFDSMLALRTASGDTLPDLDGWALSPGEWEQAYARSLPSEAPLARQYADRALAASPLDPERRGELGRLLFDRDEFRASLPYLQAAVAGRPADPFYLLLLGFATLATGNVTHGSELLERARATGGDSVFATSVLAEVATGEKNFVRGAAEARRALQGLHPTLATPFPAALENAMRRLSEEAPPEIAASLFEDAVRLRPSWDLAYHGGARSYLRWGGAHCQRGAQLAGELERFGWTTSEIVQLVRSCGHP